MPIGRYWHTVDLLEVITFQCVDLELGGDELEFSCAWLSHQLMRILPNNMAGITCGKNVDVDAAGLQSQLQLVHLANMVRGDGLEP